MGFSRDALVICTKGGYLPFDGSPPRNIADYIQETFVTPGIANFDDFVAGSHCMTPAYLQNQLEQSLQNMNVECADVYYIHNLESQLGHISESEFYYRLSAAFDRLEANRREGKLKTYGVATWNGFRVSRNQGYHSLGRMVDAAHRGWRISRLSFHPTTFNLACLSFNSTEGSEQ